MLTASLNQSLLRGGQCLPLREVRRVLRAVNTSLTLPKGEREGVVQHVSVAFVSEQEIKRLNATYRGKNKVTDVLSFGIADDRLQIQRPTPNANTEHELGEILICYPQAQRQAREMKHSVRQELLFLLVHGLLHLNGFDHERPADAKQLFALQTKILDSLGIDSRL